MGKISLISLGISMFMLAFIVGACVENASIDSWLDRSKDAGNPQQVSEFLKEYKESLYKNNKVEGKYTSVFKYPGGYMPTYIRVIDGLIGRAQELSRQSPTETSFQMGLLNLEKDLGDIEPVANLVWIASGGWILITFCSVFVGMFLVFGLISTG